MVFGFQSGGLFIPDLTGVLATMGTNSSKIKSPRGISPRAPQEAEVSDTEDKQEVQQRGADNDRLPYLHAEVVRLLEDLLKYECAFK